MAAVFTHQHCQHMTIEGCDFLAMPQMAACYWFVLIRPTLLRTVLLCVDLPRTCTHTCIAARVSRAGSGRGFVDGRRLDACVTSPYHIRVHTQHVRIHIRNRNILLGLCVV